MRSVLIRKRCSNGSIVDTLPKMVQFDESSDDYRCCCDCFHVRTGAMMVGGTEVIMLLYFLINSIFLIAQHDSRYVTATVQNNSDVIGPFVGCLTGVGIGVIVLLLLFIGIAKKYSVLLIPHMIIQGVAIVAFIIMLICGIIALSTNRTIFYRLLNATPFNAHPVHNTVQLDTESTVRVYVILFVYGISLILECWFIVVIYYCYRYLNERCEYMRYCQAYSTPMKTLSPR